MALKHIGRMIATKRKVVVAYRTLPGDAFSALVIPTESLNDENHDALIKVVESPAGQEAYELATVLARSSFPDGSRILANLHVQGKLQKVSTSDVEMTPDLNTTLALSELNQIIAEQKGVSIQDLAISDDSNTKEKMEVQDVASVNEVPQPEALAESQTANIPNDTGVLSDEDLARQFRSDADRLSKEAAALRRKAEELVPTKKISKKTKTSA
jgi:hypothetical protein